MSTLLEEIAIMEAFVAVSSIMIFGIEHKPVLKVVAFYITFARI